MYVFELLIRQELALNWIFFSIKTSILIGTFKKRHTFKKLEIFQQALELWHSWNVRAQLCPTLHHAMDCSPPGSSIPGTHQARILEWVAMPSSGYLAHPGIEPGFPMSPALAGRLFTTELLGKPTGGVENSIGYVQYSSLGESPWTEEPGVLQSMGSQRVRHDWVTQHSAARVIKYSYCIGQI